MRLLIIFLLVIVSCNSSKKPEKENVTGPKMSKESVLANPEIKYSDFENEIFEEIEKIKNSSSDTRKEHLISFISYSNLVDGAIAEGYSNFAYEYPNENVFDFFSILTLNDTTLLSKWASIASSELILIMENIESPDEFETKLKKEIEMKIDKKLSADHQAIAKFYYEKLIKYLNPNIEN
jgi:hypothetical protein